MNEETNTVESGKESEGKNYKKNIWSAIIHSKEFPILLVLLGLILVITVITPKFISGSNIYNLSRQISFVGFLALGELFVILTSGIDLSVGSVMGFSGIICGFSMAAGLNPIVAVVFGIFAGLLLGLFNGFFVSRLKITPFIVTLAMLSMARSSIWILTKGWPITEINETFLKVGQGSLNLGLFRIPIPVVLMILFAVVCHVVLRYTVFGRRIYAIGGNEEATALSGINVNKIKLIIYGISGAFAAVSGILLVARFSSAQSSVGEGWELDAIAAAVIGGTSLMGGSGSVLGVLIGAAIMGVIRNGLVLIKVSAYWQELIIGAIILIAAIIDRMKKK